MDEVPLFVANPPPGWMKKSSPIAGVARALSLWETTVFLIKNEWCLSQDQPRFLAMVLDHKVSERIWAPLEIVAEHSSAGVRRTPKH